MRNIIATLVLVILVCLLVSIFTISRPQPAQVLPAPRRRAAPVKPNQPADISAASYSNVAAISVPPRPPPLKEGHFTVLQVAGVTYTNANLRLLNLREGSLRHDGGIAKIGYPAEVVETRLYQILIYQRS